MIAAITSVQRAASTAFNITKIAVNGWLQDGAGSMGAALAFYSAFSIAPLLVIVLSIAGFAFDSDQLRDQILAQLDALLGERGAAAVATMLDSVSIEQSGILPTVLGFSALLLGATTAFVELQNSLNKIWRAPPRSDNGLISALLARVMSFGLVLGIGFLLLTSLVISTLIASITAYASQWLPAGGVLLRGVDLIISLGVVSGMFACIFKWLPNVENEWRHVWIGALITAVLFNLGRIGIGVYLGQSVTSSAYGAAGAFVVLLLWLYYSAQVFLLGAEFTWAVACHDREQREKASQATVAT